MHFVAPGTSILEKLHSLVKYFGTNFELKVLLLDVEPPLPKSVLEFESGAPGFKLAGLALVALLDDNDDALPPNKFPTIAVAVDTRLDVLFFDESSAENT